MATTTAQLTLSSADLTGDVLNLSVTATLTNAGTTTGISQTTGVARKIYYSAQTATLLFAAASYSDNTAHKVYVRNLSTTPSEYINLELGSGNLPLGRLYAGDWAFFPWDGTNDIDIDTSASNMTIEYALLFED